MNFFNLEKWNLKYERKHLKYLVKFINRKKKIQVMNFYWEKIKNNWRLKKINLRTNLWKIKKKNYLNKNTLIIKINLKMLISTYKYERNFFYLRFLKFRTPWLKKKYLNPPLKKKLFSWVKLFFFQNKYWCLTSTWIDINDLFDMYIFFLSKIFLYTDYFWLIDGVIFYYFIEFSDFTHFIETNL